MPFTPAHPAAIIPLARLGLPLSALIVGSLAPDFAKIFTLKPGNHFGHSWSGILWFSLPVGLFSLWIFHRILREPLYALLPGNLQQRLAPWMNPFPFRQPRRFALICFSICLGAFTHLLWDSFTHQHGLGARHLPILQSTVIDTRFGPLKLFKVLQHFSTVAGMAIVLGWLALWVKSAPLHPVNERYRLSASNKLKGWAMVTLTALTISLWQNVAPMHVFSEFVSFTGRFIVCFMAMFVIGTMLFSMAWHLLPKAMADRQISENQPP